MNKDRSTALSERNIEYTTGLRRTVLAYLTWTTGTNNYQGQQRVREVTSDSSHVPSNVETEW